MSKETGELEENIFTVIRTIFWNKKHFNIWTLKWEFSWKGF
jgi:hypothetical protein